jgi:hypothetical protein
MLFKHKIFFKEMYLYDINICILCIRIVRVGVIQHQIVLPTTAPLVEQRNAIYDKVGKIISLAAEANVNVLCLQEAWRKVVIDSC